MNRPAIGLATGLALLAGIGIGWLAARAWPVADAAAAPREWVARIGADYISEATFVDEMRRRGGSVPGQYQTLTQKRALLDDMLYRAALVHAARAEGLDEQPELRRAIDQLLANQYLQDTLRAQQQAIVVGDDEVRAHFDANADDYIVPARRRVAMLQILVPEGAGAEAWESALQRGQEALAKAQALNGSAPHFGMVAREYSQDQASRYRGGVIGWISEGQAERYRFDKVVLDAAQSLSEPGEFSGVLRGSDGIYVVRLVELEPRRERAFQELAPGIQQRLLRERLAASEERFRTELLQRAGVDVREGTLARIDPLAPPADPQPPRPPPMPADS